MFNRCKAGLTLATLAAMGMTAIPALAQNPLAGDAASSSYGNGDVYALNPTTGAQVGTFISGADATTLGHAVGIAFDSSGDLFATGTTGAILEYHAATGTVSTVVAATGSGNNALAISGGSLYVSNNGTSGTTGEILRYTLTGTADPSSGNSGAVFATSPNGVGGGGLAFDNAGNLFASNQTNTGPIYEISSTGATTALTYVAAASTSGTAAQNNLDSPIGLAVGPNGNLFIGQYYGEDNGTNNVLQATLSGTTLTGSEFVVTALGNTGHNVGVSFDAAGNLYVDNTGLGQILRYTSSGALDPSAGNTGAVFATVADTQYIAFAPSAAPEPSQFAAFGLGILGLGALAVKARRRGASSAAS